MRIVLMVPRHPCNFDAPWPLALIKLKRTGIIKAKIIGKRQITYIKNLTELFGSIKEAN